MLLVLCVDLDDDLGRKTGTETPVVGRDAVEDAAVALATADPEDSDVNVLFEGVHLAEDLGAEERVVVAAVTGVEGSDVQANRAVGAEVDEVLAGLQTGEEVRAVVVTDGAQDESVLPVVRSRVRIDSVRRVVVRQAQDLESMYYTIKQVVNDPETRGTILVPLGVLLLIYPLAVVASLVGLPGAVLGLASGALGVYVLVRGLGLAETADGLVERARDSLYTGRVTLITYAVAAALLVIGGVEGVNQLHAQQAASPGPLPVSSVVAALVNGAVTWFAAAGLTSSVGQITDEYLHDQFTWQYLNAPFYVLALAAVLYALSGFFLQIVSLPALAAVLTAGTLMSVLSTLAFAILEDHQERASAA